MPASASYTPIQLYRSSTSALAPVNTTLAVGELFINYADTDMAIYSKNASNVVKRLINNPAGLKYPIADGTANQVLKTDGSGTLAFTNATIPPATNTADYIPQWNGTDSHTLKNGYVPESVVCPTGALMHWPKSTPPTGWLVRDGSAISRTTYAALFAVIGTDFGNGDGVNTFNLPDDREVLDGSYKSGSTAFGTFGAVTGSKDAVVVAHAHTAGSTSTVTESTHNHIGGWRGGPGGTSLYGEVGVTSGYGYAWQAGDSIASYTSSSKTNLTVGTSTTVDSSGVTGVNANIPPTRAYLPIIKYL